MPSIIPKITINGKESTEISGLIIVSLPPIIKPAMRAVAEEIDGRDGDQIEKLGFSAYDKTIRIALSGNYDVDDVIEYFNQDGIITFSNEPDKYYRFKQLEGIDFEKLMRYKTADVVFHCQPFKFSTTEEELTFFEPHSVSITNAGNIYSKPEIALTGHGNMEMGINGSPVLAVDFGDEQQTIIIDSEKMNAYGAQSNIKSLITEINPKQDLHGYDSAWMEKGNNSPYLFRKVAGTASRFGNAVIDQIVGGTIAWNQNCQIAQGALHENVATETFSDGVWNFTATDLNSDSVGWYAEYSNKPNHVCFIACDVNPTNNVTMKLGMMDRDYFNVAGGVYTRIETIRTENVDARPVCYAMLNGLGLNSFSFECKNVNFIDLTQMLGSTIANYILSLEQATAGAGVSYFRALFPNGYYPYNAGELLSVKALAHNTIGFNQWDENWRIITQSNQDWLTNANPIPVLPNTAYYIKMPNIESNASIDSVSATGAYISYIGGYKNSIFITPNNCHFIRFLIPTASYGTTYNHDICINVSDASVNGAYKAYSINRYLLDDDLELRGIPQIDANGKLTYDGDKYSSDGSVVRKYGIITLDGTQTSTGDYANLAGNRIVRFVVSDVKTPETDSSTIGMLTSQGFANLSPNAQYGSSGGALSSVSSRGNTHEIMVVVAGCTTKADVISYLTNKPLHVTYELASSTSETAQPFTNPQNVDANGSEEYIDGHVYGIVDLGSLDWIYTSGEHSRFETTTVLPNSKVVAGNIIPNASCSKYKIESMNNVYSHSNDKILGYDNYVWIYDSNAGTDATAFKASLNGIYLFYELASSPSVELPVGHNTLYANICEINGWNSCDVKRTGKNLLIPFVERTITENGITFVVNSDGTIHATGRSNLFHRGDMLAQNLRAGNYVISDGVERSAHYMLEIAIWQNGNLNYYSTSGIDHFTISDGDSVQSIYISIFDGAGDVDLIFQPQIELGSEATDFEAYEGITKNISFNQTVYKARLNIKTGRMEILGAVADIGAMDWSKQGDYFQNSSSQFASQGWERNKITLMAECYHPIAWSTIDGGNAHDGDIAQLVYSGNGIIRIYNSAYETAGEFKNAMDGMHFLYLLPEPVILQLTAQEIMALIGENHIFTNTGAIESCVYMKDGAEIEASGEIITFIADVGDIISNAFKNRLVIGNYDDVKLEKGINTITFNPIEEGSEIDEMAISKYSRWL